MKGMNLGGHITIIKQVFSKYGNKITVSWYDFESKERIASEVTLIRRYHRLFYGLTLSMDETLDRQAVVLSIWPEGVRELSFGSRRYMGLDSPDNRNEY